MSQGASLRCDKIWADDERGWYQSLTHPPQENYCDVDGGGFHKISSPNQQAGNDGQASGWADTLPAETTPDIMLLPVSESCYKKAASMAQIWHQKYS